MPTDNNQLPEALLDPEAYPERPRSVELIATHISWVFLAGRSVYKLRRPVDFGFLDFTTLGRRRADCHREIELNRPLAPGVYLGVERVVERGGRLRIGGPGRVVDYAVRMRRLPPEAFLDAMVRAGSATAAHVEAIADRLARFHAGAPSGPAVGRFGSPAVLRTNWRENFDQWAPWVGRVLTAGEDREIREYVRRSLRRLRPALLARIEDGRVREVHGDLRAAQIAFAGERPLILDRVEFSRRLRSVDVAADASFLAMDLESMGREDLAKAFVRRYVEKTQDFGLAPLFDLYRCHRASIRAKVALLRSAQLEGGERQAAETEARRFFDLALGYARRRMPPFLAIMSGLSGTGKSTLARELARRTGARLVASDAVRKRLAGLRPEESGRDAFGTGIYTEEWTRRTYDALYAAARRALRSGEAIILDAAFLRRSERERARDLAREFGVPFRCIETVLPAGEVRRRLDAREAAGGSVSDATWAVYRSQRRFAEPVDELAAVEAVRVAMGRGLREGIAAGLRALLEPAFAAMAG